jgi:hypothetical protein
MSDKKNYSVKTFIVEQGKDKEAGMGIRKVTVLADNLSWQLAKSLAKENKGSWIV